MIHQHCTQRFLHSDGDEREKEEHTGRTANELNCWAKWGQFTLMGSGLTSSSVWKKEKQLTLKDKQEESGCVLLM